jgi:hypothetical protein
MSRGTPTDEFADLTRTTLSTGLRGLSGRERFVNIRDGGDAACHLFSCTPSRTQQHVAMPGEPCDLVGLHHRCNRTEKGSK